MQVGFTSITRLKCLGRCSISLIRAPNIVIIKSSCQMLIMEGASIEAVDYLGRTPLMLAVMKPRAIPVVGEGGGVTVVVGLLWFTVAYGTLGGYGRMEWIILPFTEHLLDHGAEIGKADIDGNTVFHLVCAEK